MIIIFWNLLLIILYVHWKILEQNSNLNKYLHLRVVKLLSFYALLVEKDTRN
jgi:hypothetical protein